MSLKLYAMTCGQLTGDLGMLLEGGEGDIKVPIPAYLIDERKGTLLYYTGWHPDCRHDPAGRVGEQMAQLFRFDFSEGEDVRARLMDIDRDPDRIDLIV